MSAFLQQQGVGVTLGGMPILEVGVAAVADEVTAPDGFDFADFPGIDELFHLAGVVHVAHVVTDHQFGAVAVGGFKDTVGSSQCDGKGFFHVDRHFVLQSENAHLFVKKVGSSNKNTVQIFLFDHLFVVFVDIGFALEFFLIAFEEKFTGIGVDVSTGNDPHAVFRLVGIICQCAAAGTADDTETKFFFHIAVSCNKYYEITNKSNILCQNFFCQ